MIENIPEDEPPYLISFSSDISDIELPIKADPFNTEPPEIAKIAARELQDYLINQKDFEHNFGLSGPSQAPIIGKMFGVLVVKTPNQKIGYLAAFSGKLAGGNHHDNFVPPVYDMLSPDGFISDGMVKLQQFSQEISLAKDMGESKTVEILQHERAEYSRYLQEKLFENYQFTNHAGEKKNLTSIFNEYQNRKPPSAAGECAAPKLFQYAYSNNLKPLGIAEFWWGLSLKSTRWKHKQDYPACEDKCRPILDFMIGG